LAAAASFFAAAASLLAESTCDVATFNLLVASSSLS
jgi:hypothetical protein